MKKTIKSKKQILWAYFSYIPFLLFVWILLVPSVPVHANPITFTDVWVQDAVGLPGEPTFGIKGLGTQTFGTFTEDHRFGDAANASGVISSTNLMPGLLRASSTVTGVSTGVDSGADIRVQFSRAFNLEKEAVVTVDTLLSGFLDITVNPGNAFVLFNAGIADPGGNIIFQVYQTNQSSLSISTSSLLIEQNKLASAMLDPGDYKVWGYLGTGGDMFLTGRATSNFLSGGLLVNVTAVPVPEPNTMLLLGSGLIGLIGYNYRRRKQAA